MKKNSLAWAFFLCLFYGFSQNPYTNAVNLQLRSVFQYITYPNPNIGFLYDRSVKMSDSTFYDNNSPDTLDPQSWRQLYNEMYYAAHDTLPYQPDSVVNKNGNKFYPDTIPFAIMDYSYYYCKYNALNTDSFFIFDTINDFLYDKPSPPSSPFGISNIFACAPAVETGNFTNVVFRIDPQLLFTDAINGVYYQNSNYLRIDFGDGTGWHTFDPTVVTHYNASYSSNGEMLITAALFDKRRPGRPIKTSKSRFRILRNHNVTKADETLEVDGLNVGVFKSCGDAKKVIIYLEGIDMLDFIPSKNRGVDLIFDEMIHSERIEELRNFDYQYYVVDWKKSTIDMRFNSLYLLNLIERLKKAHQGLDDEQFVIIGESMGGVIGRYTLTFMETQDYLNGNFTSFFVEATDPRNALYLLQNPGIFTVGHKNRIDALVPHMHNTRLLITLDSPHQGASISLSIQHAYRKAMNLFFPASYLFTNAFSLGLESKAARQLLIYHIGAKTSPLSNISGYQSDPSHPSFYGQMEKMGNYPRYCKLVALSNGALSGDNQEQLFTGAPRVPGDRLLEFKAQLYARILWIRLPILTGVLNMYTNPDPSGTFFSSALGNFTFKIKLKFWKIKINNTYSNLFSDNQIALNVKPYCTSAGGFYPGPEVATAAPASYNLSQNWLLNVFDYNLTNDGAGCVKFASHIGWQGFSSLNFSYNLCSDGFQFGFIPLQSGLDYGKNLNLPLNTNIQNLSAATNLPRTPFDVIIGYPNKRNYQHLDYNNPHIYNITGVGAPNCGQYSFYTADAALQCGVNRSMLSMEIGEEEMYLENMTVNRPADYSAQFDILVNSRNPYYKYVSQGAQKPLLLGAAFSKEKPFITTGSGQVDFFSDATNSPTGTGLVITPNGPLNYTGASWVMNVCTTDYATDRLASPEIKSTEAAAVDGISSCLVYPNPQSGQALKVEGIVKKAGAGLTLSICDVTGRQLLSQHLQSGTDKRFYTAIDLQGLGLAGGVYLVRVISEEEVFTRQLVIY